MDGHFEQQIRRRAYELWVEGGRPHGHECDHWQKAECELKMQHEHATPKKPSRAKAAAPAAKPAARKAPARRKTASA